SDASATRHVFPQETTLLPYQYLVVFGGGSPHLNGVFWQLASTGALSLNNSNETIFLRDTDAYPVDQIYYGSEGDKDQSLTRFPEGTSPIFVGHKSLPQAGGAAFSPGTSVDGKPLEVSPAEPLVVNPVEPLAVSSVEPLAAAAVPELPTLIYGIFGALGLARRRMTW
ncbi:MAG: lamin tail domain-containing protein, partial [Candidatus Omnitrophica bacterium]|nr:lamin tail domain-containing protein [Candidatus Omnitrophota bacterium]